MTDDLEFVQKSSSYRLYEISRNSLREKIAKSTFDHSSWMRNREILISAIFDCNYVVPLKFFKNETSLSGALNNQFSVFLDILKIKKKSKNIRFENRVIENYGIKSVYNDAAYVAYEAEQALKFLYNSLREESSHVGDGVGQGQNIKNFSKTIKRLLVIRNNKVHPEKGIAFNESTFFEQERIMMFLEAKKEDHQMIKLLFYKNKNTLRGLIDILFNAYIEQLEIFENKLKYYIEGRNIVTR